MNSLPLNTRKRYWRSLIHQQAVPDPRLYPGLVEELRAALRDALREIPDAEKSLRWRGEWIGKC